MPRCCSQFIQLVGLLCTIDIYAERTLRPQPQQLPANQSRNTSNGGIASLGASARRALVGMLPPSYLTDLVKPYCVCSYGSWRAVRYCPEIVAACGLDSDVPSEETSREIGAALAQTDWATSQCFAASVAQKKRVSSVRRFLGKCTDNGDYVQITSTTKQAKFTSIDQWNAGSIPLKTIASTKNGPPPTASRRRMLMAPPLPLSPAPPPSYLSDMIKPYCRCSFNSWMAVSYCPEVVNACKLRCMCTLLHRYY